MKFLVALSLLIANTAAAQPARQLRVCADQNNFPLTHSALPGFETAVAAVIGRQLEARVEYTWRAQKRGFLRDTLLKGDCDIVLGAPAGMRRVRTTRPVSASVDNVIGFLVQGDVATVWGPRAGGFAHHIHMPRARRAETTRIRVEALR